ncbi:Adaptive-response sensory-kinase SasA [Sporomusa acidovorans DSM 3132]|uniref:histidine kinase n=3 Tax=Sporomusa TaxID=2375 RepID=A0ABZ3J9E1_SPOA4|nr:ATP-binding protein [Sporomusa acidovorans]OZC16055.1 sporulation kinase E [Sporomusa acidovorans DSM 3132]SDD88174.1 Signal transduction histidine kinase [Sporomusa acidovorans]
MLWSYFFSEDILAKIIGDEQFSLEHRVLNILLILGLLLSVFSTVFNYIIDLQTEIFRFCIFVDVTLLCLYYVSIVKRKYWTVIYPAIFMCIFIFTPAIWIYNGGLLGGGTFDFIFFSSIIAILLTGLKRVAAIGSLLLVILFMAEIDAMYPFLTIGYSDDFTRKSDIISNLILILIANSFCFGLFMNYYKKEQQKSKEYLIQIEKQNMDNALSRLDRLNLVGEMAASIGHEIRNPLTTVRGYLQLFQRKQMYAEHVNQFQIMIEELDRTNAIITEFLSLAKNKTVAFESGSLNEIIQALLPLLQADALHTGHELQTEMGEIPAIKLDKKEIRQLLLNLVRNALEATPPGGKVVIKTECQDGNVVLFVQDTGCGIPKDVLDKLGIPFLTTKEKGTGLGLPVCYRIVARHNAKLEVVTGSSGTTFYVKFKLP